MEHGWQCFPGESVTSVRTRTLKCETANVPFFLMLVLLWILVVTAYSYAALR